MIKQDNGTIVILALMLLSILSLIAVSAHYLGITEIQITTNEYANKKALYHAESASRQAMKELQLIDEAYLKEDLVSEERTTRWLHEKGYEFNVQDDANWVEPDSKSVYQTGQYMAVHVSTGGTSGDSLKMTNRKEKMNFAVFSRSTNGGGRALIEIGYSRWILK